jgi:hypothetical protein
MSANSAVTILRSPSATSATVCSDAIRTDDVEELREFDFDTSEVSASAHSAQNFASCAFRWAHFGHARLSGAAHWLQNLAPAAFSLPHFVQRIATFPEADDQVSRLDGLIHRRNLDSGAPRKVALDRWDAGAWQGAKLW